MVISLIRYGAYPIIFGSAAWGLMALATRGTAPWPAFAAIALIAIALVALLERVQPYHPEWLSDHNDTLTDLVHVLVNFALLSITAYTLHAGRNVLPHGSAWPMTWPVWAQVLLAGAILDLGLYTMHRLSHHVEWLWRLHAAHHSALRLYWMNGERRHPLSAVVIAAPGLLVAVGIGAPPLIISTWLAVLSVHLAFQHANLDYSLGPLRAVLGVAESHRWHHKREYEDAQVNFGEFWLCWDHLFGTYRDPRSLLGARDVGLQDTHFPTRYLAQLRWPFVTRLPSAQYP